MHGLMIQGTSSDVGKSIVMTALCRIFANRQFKVAPFKSQNMSNRLYTTKNGDIISFAQQNQAEAAKQEPIAYMNPIVLNMQKEMKSEVILLGKRKAIVSGKEYRENFYRSEEHTSELQSRFDLVCRLLLEKKKKKTHK